MMSLSVLSAGDGYEYYLKETASQDVARGRDRELGDYYLAHGAPPGQWIGSGATTLGVAGTVQETQMRALMGEGLHPEAERIITDEIAGGASAARAQKAARLGRRYYQYDCSSSPIGQAITEEYARFERTQHRAPTTDERRALRMKVAGAAFRERHGRGAKDSTELGGFLNKQLRSGRQSVAGYDATFSPPKSVSVLWALASDDTSRRIERAHERAIGGAVELLERDGIGSRTGVNGVAKIDVSGLVGMKFRHYDSRTGDPQLHDHLVIANKVQDPQTGKWLSVDGTLLHQMAVTVSESYNRLLAGELRDAGFALEAREPTPGKNPVAEITGVDRRLLDWGSTRKAAIAERTASLVAEYREAHGREPSAKILRDLKQRATLETRPTKKDARPLAEMKSDWRTAAAAAVGTDTVARLEPSARAAWAVVSPDGLDLDAAAGEVISRLEAKRSWWRESHVRAEAERYLTYHPTSDPAAADALTQAVLDTRSLRMTPDSDAAVNDALVRRDGQSIYTPRNSTLYTSQGILDAEDRLLAAARQVAIPSVSAEVFDQTLAAHQGPLDPGQVDLAHEVACGETILSVGIGPAGAGKSTAMRLAVDAVHAGGGQVRGLSLSAVAAQNLAETTGSDAHTVAKWLQQRDAAAQGRVVAPEYDLSAGDVVLVDEAGMAGTLTLDRILDDVQRAGAHVRLIGDPQQLQAVESGGALRMIAEDVGAVELSDIHRFQTDGEAEASLALRTGDASWYVAHDRITGGDGETMMQAVTEAWTADRAAGRDSLMIADTNADVTELNGIAQASRIDHGLVDLAQTVPLADGHDAGIGDLLVTRKVDRDLRVGGRDFVKNGDRWTLTALDDDGAATVRRADGRSVDLPAQYLARHTQLGYASTAHRAQGRTVDTVHVLARDSASRQGFYVGMTRGRHENHAYLVTEDRSQEQVLAAITSRDTTDQSARGLVLTEQGRVDSLTDLSAEHHDVVRRADTVRYAHRLTQTHGAAARAFLDADAFPALCQTLRNGENAGYDLDQLLGRCDGILGDTTVGDASAVASAGVDRWMEKASTVWEQAQESPLAPLSDEQVESLRTITDTQIARAIADLPDSAPVPVTVNGAEQPAWPDRQYGDLTDRGLATQTERLRWLRSENTDQANRLQRERDQLARRIERIGMHPTPPQGRMTAMRQQLATLDTRIDASRERQAAVQRDLQAIATERQLRTRMPGDAARTETAQRLRADHPVPTVATSTAAVAPDRLDHLRTLQARLDAQVRARRHAPRTPAATEDPDRGLPAWLAPDRGRGQLPSDWSDVIEARRDLIAQRLDRRGQDLAADPPSWAAALRDPAVEGPQRTAWERTAARVDAWRELNGYENAERPLPRTSSLDDPRHRSEAEALNEEIRALRQPPEPAESERPPRSGESARWETQSRQPDASSAGEDVATPRRKEDAADATADRAASRTAENREQKPAQHRSMAERIQAARQRQELPEQQTRRQTAAENAEAQRRAEAQRLAAQRRATQAQQARQSQQGPSQKR